MATGEKSCLSVVLPIPPTINHYYGLMPRGRGKYITKSGKKFREDVAWVMSTKKQFGDAPLAVFIQWFMPSNRGDVDNRIKPLLDALQHAGTFDDDKQVIDIRAIIMHPVKGGRCNVKIWVKE